MGKFVWKISNKAKKNLHRAFISFMFLIIHFLQIYFQLSTLGLLNITFFTNKFDKKNFYFFFYFSISFPHGEFLKFGYGFYCPLASAKDNFHHQPLTLPCFVIIVSHTCAANTLTSSVSRIFLVPMPRFLLTLQILHSFDEASAQTTPFQHLRESRNVYPQVSFLCVQQSSLGGLLFSPSSSLLVSGIFLYSSHHLESICSEAALR